MGQLKNVLICSATSGGVVRGDTVTIGGVTWVCATSGGSSDTQNTLLIKG